MPKFDHRFDNYIQKKEDLRFVDQNDAEEYAEAQCLVYGSAQNVVPCDEELFKVVEHPTRLPLAVYFVDEIVGQ